MLKGKDCYSITKMRYFIYFLALFFMVSCTSSNTMYKKPEDLIPKDTMKLLLTDMYLAVASKNVKDKCSKRRGNYLPFVFEKYKIDSTRFYGSNNYYTSRIEDYKDILTDVKTELQKELSFFETEMNFKDSLKRDKKEKNRSKIKLRDSLKKAYKSKDYIPFILQEFKIDSTRFYSNNAYNIKEEAYSLILNEVNDSVVLVKKTKQSKPLDPLKSKE